MEPPTFRAALAEAAACITALMHTKYPQYPDVSLTFTARSRGPLPTHVICVAEACSDERDEHVYSTWQLSDVGKWFPLEVDIRQQS